MSLRVQNRIRHQHRATRRDLVHAVVVSIGINYMGSSAQLNGCQNDSDNFLKLVRMRLGVHGMLWTRQMKDSLPSSSNLYPSRANIERVMKEAVAECRRNTRVTHLFVHFSGHGGQVHDVSGDEEDGMDETWMPVDFESAGEITDDWLLDHCIKPIPQRIAAFWLMDCCHSGSQLDLRYSIEPNTLGTRVTRRIINRHCPQLPRAVLISGCQDHNYSYDVWDKEHGPTGAMSVAFMRNFLRDPAQPMARLVANMRRDLKRAGYPQIPQLSSTRPLTGVERVPGLSF
jgi:metacaspase-1